MKKYPFTPAGFQELQQVLYALPDDVLALEAAEILNDFPSWMNVHFELAAKQLAFLHNISIKALKFIAFQTSFAVENRLPVNLIKQQNRSADPDPDPDPDPDDGKIIRPKSRLSATSDNEGGFEADGELDIEIFYIP